MQSGYLFLDVGNAALTECEHVLGGATIRSCSKGRVRIFRIEGLFPQYPLAPAGVGVTVS